MRVLVVEDSSKIRQYVAKALKRSGYAVDATANGDEGLELAQLNPYDALVLDIMLPGLDGLSILEQLRSEGRDTPILLLTAKDTVDDRVRGLRTGADDYLVKPFALEELLARVEVLCRRRYDRHTTTQRVADLELDTLAKTVARGGRPIELAAREYALLEYLVMRRGQVVSRTEIEEHIYDELVSPMSNVVDAAIYTLRRRLAVTPESPRLIRTRRGLGYVLEAPAT
jgi:DNA-binding response OmpR family regulator